MEKENFEQSQERIHQRQLEYSKLKIASNVMVAYLARTQDKVNSQVWERAVLPAADYIANNLK